jgi:hypothetical protein
VRVKTQYEKISVLVVHDVLLEDPWREEIGTGGAQVETRNDDVTDRTCSLLLRLLHAFQHLPTCAALQTSFVLRLL